MKSIFTYVVVFIGFLICNTTSTNAQSFRLFYHPQFQEPYTLNITHEAGSYYFFAKMISLPNNAYYFKSFITQVKGNDTLMRFLPFNFNDVIGVTAWNGRPYVYTDLSSYTMLNITLVPLDSQLNLMSDSISIDSIASFPNNFDSFSPRSRISNNKWLFAYTTSNNVVTDSDPAMLIYNFQTGTVHHRTFEVNRQIYYPFEDVQASNPAIFPHDNGYYIAFDTSLQSSYVGNIIKATSFLDLDTNLNTRSHHLLEYPSTGAGFSIGLKSVRDYIPIGSQKLFVGIINRDLRNGAFRLSYTNNVGIMRYDSIWNVIDTLEIVRPRTFSLTPSVENAACWCSGSLFTVSNLSWDSLNFTSSGQFSRILIAKIDTPLQLKWTRTISLPWNKLQAEIINCVNGKIQIAGNFQDHNFSISGNFILEMDTHGNYLPLESSDIAKSAIGAPYPNPFNQEINLPETEIPIKQFTLFDLNGRRLYQEDYPEKNPSLPQLSNGFYLWEITLENDQRFRGKIMKN